MRLIVECEHGEVFSHGQTCHGGDIVENPDDILAALAEAGVLKRREYRTVGPMKPIEYSAWTWEESE